MFPPLEIVADDGHSRHPVADWCSCRVAEGPPHRATYVASPRQKKSSESPAIEDCPDPRNLA